MKRFLLGLVIASITIILGVVAVLAWERYTAEPCIDFPNSPDRYVIVIDKTTGQRIRIKNCARP